MEIVVGPRNDSRGSSLRFGEQPSEYSKLREHNGSAVVYSAALTERFKLESLILAQNER